MESIKPLAQIAKEYFIENNLKSISYGDLHSLGNIYSRWARQFPKKKVPHPINQCNSVLNALDKNPDEWKKTFFRARSGLARSFTLK